MFTHTTEGLDTLKLKPIEQEIIATFLQDQARRPERRRAVRRYRFLNPAGLIIRVLHPGGTSVAYRVQPRDLSELGLGFLHGNFLYPDSVCRVDLRDREGKMHSIPAKIVRCDHVSGRVHDVGLSFDQAIDASPFVEIAIEEAQPVAEVPKQRPSYWRKPE